MSRKHSDWLVVKSKAKSQVSEAYHTLRTNIEFYLLYQEANKIAQQIN